MLHTNSEIDYIVADATQLAKDLSHDYGTI